MPLDREYFAGIKPETVRGKFYRKSEIDAILKAIAARVEAQTTENELLSMKLRTAENAVMDHAEGMSQVANTIVSDAKEEAERILADARKAAEAEAGEILAEAREKSRSIVEATMRQQELAAAKIEESYSAMKEQHEECIDSIRSAWQEFLIGLDSEEDAEPSGEKGPADLSEKVCAIADVLSEIGSQPEE